MKEKIIEFIYPENSKNLFEDVFPIPAKLNIPDWFKKLEHKREYRTIKGCMPFLDTLTAGYILKLSQDFYFKYNFINKDNQKGSEFQVGWHTYERSVLDIKGMNVNAGDPQYHPKGQLGEDCPFHKKNKDQSYFKILNPFVIKTPPGYSCLFVPILNNNDDRFQIIPGIVDTDTFDLPVNFPIIINGDRYPNLETIVKKGTPYAQVIPFKRDDWKIKFSEGRRKNYFFSKLKICRQFLNNYKDTFWSKKKWN